MQHGSGTDQTTYYCSKKLNAWKEKKEKLQAASLCRYVHPSAQCLGNKCVQHKHSWPAIQISVIKKQKSLTSSVQVFYFDSLLAVSSLEDLLGQRKAPEGGR